MRSKTQISVRHIKEMAIFDVIGLLSEESEEEWRAACEQADMANATRILINFDQRSFITSSGFGLIVKLISKARNTGQILRVAHPNDSVRKNFEVIGLTRSIEVFASEEEALADF